MISGRIYTCCSVGRRDGDGAAGGAGRVFIRGGWGRCFYTQLFHGKFSGRFSG